MMGVLAIGLWTLLAFVIQIPATFFHEARIRSVSASEAPLRGPRVPAGHGEILRTAAREPLAVPLTVQALAPVGGAGMAREDEPVTVGIPLPDDLAIRDVSELEIVGAEHYQLRALGHWAETGNVKWVLADFLASLDSREAREGVVLTRVEEPSGPRPPLAIERNHRIEIDTGPMHAVLSREGRGLIARIEVDGKVLVDDENAFSLVAYDLDGTEYPAVVDPAERVRVVENGPVKTVVVAEGAHRSESGERLFDWRLRMTAFRGKSFLRCEYTLANGSKEAPRHVRHKGVRLSLKTGLGDALKAQFPRHEEPWEQRVDLETGDEAYYYLAYNDSRQNGAHVVRRDWVNDGWVPPVQYDFDSRRYVEEGYRIVHNGTDVQPQTASGQFAELPYGSLVDAAGAGLTASMRFGARYWPISFDTAGDGTLSVGLFSNRTDHHFTVNYELHETREFCLDFHSGHTPAYDRVYKESFPVLGRVSDVRYINRCGVLSDKLVTLDEVNEFFEATGLEVAQQPANEPWSAVRYWNAGQGGGHNQYDKTYHGLVRYWRTGDPGAFLDAKSWADYRADWAVPHSDDWTKCLNGDARFPQYHAQNAGDFLTTKDHVMDNQHRHTRGLPLMYYFTGNERYRDAFLEDTEFVTFSDRVELGYLNTRVQSKLILAGMIGYGFIGEQRAFVDFPARSGFSRGEIYERMCGYLRRILDSRYDMNRKVGGPQPKGWSDEPGEGRNDPRRFFFAGGDRERNVEPKFMLFSIFPDALWNYEFYARPDDPNVQEMRQRVLDLEHYFWTGLFSGCPDDPTQASVGEFLYKLYDENGEIPASPDCGDGDDFHPAYQLESYAYRVSGRAQHLERGVQFMFGQHHNGDQLRYLNAYRTDFQNFVWNFMHRTADIDAPTISRLRAVKANDYPLALKWVTDEPTVGRAFFWRDLERRRLTVMEDEPTQHHVLSLARLRPLTDYYLRVLNQDEAGNVAMSRKRMLIYDDFATDTISAYDLTERGGARIEYAENANAVRFHGAEGSKAVFRIDRPNRNAAGSVAFDFLGGRRYGRVGSFSIVMMQDPKNYYEISAFDSDEPGTPGLRVRKVIDGAIKKSRTAPANPFDAREGFQGRVIFRPRSVGIQERTSDEVFGINTPESSAIEVRSIRIVLHQLGGWLDNLLIEQG